MAEFAKYIRTDEITFKYSRGMRDVIGKEFHAYHEIFFFIGAEADFITDNRREKLTPFTAVIIPKETFHQFLVHGPEANYCRCVLNFESVSQLDLLIGRKLNRVYLVRDPGIAELFSTLQSLAEQGQDPLERDILLKACFAQILVKLRVSSDQLLSPPSTFHPVTRQAIQYIDQNLGNPLTALVLAEHLNISASYLSRIFKKDLNIPIHKYILGKRLILANKKIRSSMNTTQAAAESGFQDYPNFYRQYKKMFGMTPSAAKGSNS